MDILVVGSGGREHAMIRKLRQSPDCGRIFCAPGNGGISIDATCVDIAATDIPAMKAFALREHIDLCVVTPDDPLVLGMVDELQQAGILCFGPNKAAALIEGSKSFAKELMQKYSIPTAAYAVFENYAEACAYLQTQNRYPTVIKADGLALGKGVIIAENEQQALLALRDMLCDHAFGESGSRVVIEEFLTGTELSVLAFADGERVLPMVSSMDHKRAGDGDTGLNTGGMGTVAPHPLYTPEMAERCMQQVFLPTIRAMRAEDREFRGCLYFGLMLTEQGPKVIEYNCRFGDPETQVVLELLEGDLLELMLATAKGQLDCVSFSQREGAAACVIIASGGYPGDYQKGFGISGLDERGQHPLAAVYHAGTRREGSCFYSNGGRVLGVTARGETLHEAVENAYAAAKTISFSGSFYRKDIGAKVL